MNFSDSVCDLKQKYPHNHVIVDAYGRPSVMVYIPKFLLSDVIEGASEIPHPAFVVNGREISGLYISKFQNIVFDGCAYSLPSEDPATDTNFDAALAVCSRKGAGWHLMTAMEWGMIALWCQKNGFLPYGNNDLGKDIREARGNARISYRDDEKQICRTATGSGPKEWSHNGREDGIYDLNGNVWEWNAGMRLVCGELQVLPDNNGADARYAQTADSDVWRAIDGTTGEYILPQGDGNTENSVKLDSKNGVWTFVSDAVRDSYAHARFCDFNAVCVSDAICEKAKILLAALGCLPIGDGLGRDGVSLYANNGARERIPFRGGRWGQGMNAGVFKTCLDDPRSYSGAAVGFRAVYYEA